VSPGRYAGRGQSSYRPPGAPAADLASGAVKVDVKSGSGIVEQLLCFSPMLLDGGVLVGGSSRKDRGNHLLTKTNEGPT
jgi:hypothetical protein